MVYRPGGAGSRAFPSCKARHAQEVRGTRFPKLEPTFQGSLIAIDGG